MAFKENDIVLYAGKETKIQTILDNHTCVILNPVWSWEDEGLALDGGFEYNEPYEITVKLRELKRIKNNKTT